MAKITVRKNFSFVDVLNDISPTKEDMQREGEQLAVQIENRTLSGRDENNQPFAPLATAKYGKDRADLHDTSEMFKDFGVTRASRRGFALGFRSKRSERIAEYHQNGTSRMPARPFITPSARWIADMIRRLTRRRR